MVDKLNILVVTIHIDLVLVLQLWFLVHGAGQEAIVVRVLPSFGVASIFEIVQVLEDGSLHDLLSVVLVLDHALLNHFKKILPPVVR